MCVGARLSVSAARVTTKQNLISTNINYNMYKNDIKTEGTTEPARLLHYHKIRERKTDRRTCEISCELIK